MTDPTNSNTDAAAPAAAPSSMPGREPSSLFRFEYAPALESTAVVSLQPS